MGVNTAVAVAVIDFNKVAVIGGGQFAVVRPILVIEID